MADLEGIIRPFATPGVEPTPFTKPGSTGTAAVHVVIGARGGTKTFNWSASGSESFKMGAAHKETAPASTSLKSKLASASG